MRIPPPTPHFFFFFLNLEFSQVSSVWEVIFSPFPSGITWRSLALNLTNQENKPYGANL